jgi:hypothetical protein
MTWKDNEPESSYAHTERRVMTAASDREAEDLALRCPQCGGPGEFGYRDVYRAMRWFCPRHRLAQFWADARIPEIVINNGGVLTDDNDHQQIDRTVAQPAAGSFSDSADGLSWHRPSPDVDRPVLVRRPAGTIALRISMRPGASSIPAPPADARPSSAPASTHSPGSSAAGTAARANRRHHIQVKDAEG